MIDVRNDPMFYLPRKRVEQIYRKKEQKSVLTEEDHKIIDLMVIRDYLKGRKQ